MLGPIALVAIVGALSSSSGPDFFEGGDAGSQPGSAQAVFGTGAVSTIHGGLTGTGPAGSDFEDLYLIFIADPPSFLATTKQIRSSDIAHQKRTA